MASKKYVMAFVSIILCFLMLIPSMRIASATSTTLSVNPTNSYVTIGKPVSVDVYVSDVVNLTSWQFTLFFLNNVINCTNISEGPFLKNVNSTYFGKTITNNYNSTHGKLLAYSTILGNTSGAAGSGVLATVTFGTLNVSISPLHLSDTQLGDNNIPPHDIAHTDVDGTINVQNFTLSVATDGSGSVTLNNTGPYYHYNENVQLTATSAIGWTFDHWSGNLTGSINPTTLVVTGNMSVTATFTQNHYTLTIAVSGSGNVSKVPDQASYTWGTNVTITASANLGWTFAGWSGDASGISNPITVNMTGNKAINATFTQNIYSLTVNVAGSGTVTLNNTGPNYHYGDVVQLTAFPNTGWTFDHWSGGLSGSVNPATLAITGNMIVTATFVQINYTLNVATVGNGHVNLNNTGPNYHYGDVVQLTAVPDVGWTFSSWSGNLIGSSNPGTLVTTGNMSVTATFSQDHYALTIGVSGSGNVSKVPDQASYTWGTNVTITASANLGWTFAGWSGDASGTNNPITVNMTGNKAVNATFILNGYTLSIFLVGNGTVTRNSTGPYQYGDAVLLTATPGNYWSFDHWSGDLAGSVNPATLIIAGNMSVTATFAQINYTLAITIGYGNGTVVLNNTGPYHHGDAVLLTAVPGAHWIFNYWSGNLAGSTSPATLQITGNMSITAWFAQYAFTLTVNIFGSGFVARNSSGPYYYGDFVQLNATPSIGWSFLCWSGDLSGSTNPTTIFIDGNKVVNANFTWNPYTVTVNVVGNGSVTLNPNATYYNYGDVVQLTAVPASAWVFGAWSGDLTGSVNPRYLNMTSNMTVTATFAPANYSLYVGVIGLGSVTLNKTAPYHYGDAVLLIPIPNNGWGFEEWTGDLTGSANPATLIITKNMSVAAWFVKNVYTLTINIVGPGSVTLNKTGPYNFSDAVLLTANPISPASFDYWSGDLSGSINPTTLTITTNMSVTAHFTAKPMLTMNPANATCRVYGENFTLTIVVTYAVNVENCAFEIHFNTTLLDYTGVVWNAWGTGTINVNDSAGVITGSTSGSPLNGTQNLTTIRFKPACYHMWRSAPDWTNDLTDTISFQRVNLSYPSGPDLRYEKGGLNQVNVGPDFAYTFSPIQGDVDNNGKVDIFDLRTVGAFFGIAEGDPSWTQGSKYDLNGDDQITVFDLEIVAANFGYEYAP